MAREYLDNMHHAFNHGHISRFDWRCELVFHNHASREREKPPMPLDAIIYMAPPRHAPAHLRVVN